MFMTEPINEQEVFKIFDEIDSQLILCLGSVTDCEFAYENDIPFYYGFPISSYQDFNGLKLLNPEYIIPNAPLFFNMPFLKDSGVPIRLFPNIGNISDFPINEAAHGTWIRPEDIDYYSTFADAYEFVGVTIEQERALFRIYNEQKQLVGPLGLIIEELREKYSAHSDLITGTLVSSRIQCK